MTEQKPRTSSTPVQPLIHTRSRKAYSSPQLVEYGQISDVTRGGNGSATEGGGGSPVKRP